MAWLNKNEHSFCLLIKMWLIGKDVHQNCDWTAESSRFCWHLSPKRLKNLKSLSYLTSKSEILRPSSEPAIRISRLAFGGIPAAQCSTATCWMRGSWTAGGKSNKAKEQSWLSSLPRRWPPLPATKETSLQITQIRFQQVCGSVANVGGGAPAQGACWLMGKKELEGC